MYQRGINAGCNTPDLHSKGNSNPDEPDEPESTANTYSTSRWKLADSDWP